VEGGAFRPLLPRDKHPISCVGPHSLRDEASCNVSVRGVWLCIRVLFWWFTVTSTTIWDESYFELLYWMPNPLQFGSFLLFPLFFSQVLYRGKWKNVWTYVRPIYIIALACIVVFQLFWALLAFQVRCNLSLKQKIAKDR
jgi:hypothetical protein